MEGYCTACTLFSPLISRASGYLGIKILTFLSFCLSIQAFFWWVCGEPLGSLRVKVVFIIMKSFRRSSLHSIENVSSEHSFFGGGVEGGGGGRGRGQKPETLQLSPLNISSSNLNYFVYDRDPHPHLTHPPTPQKNDQQKLKTLSDVQD